MSNPTGSPGEKQGKGLRRRQETTGTVGNAYAPRMAPLVKGGLHRGAETTTCTVGAEHVNNNDTEQTQQDAVVVTYEEEQQQQQQSLREEGVEAPAVIFPSNPDPAPNDPSQQAVAAYTVADGTDLEDQREVVIAAPLKQSTFWKTLSILTLLLAIVIAVVLAIVFTRDDDQPSGASSGQQFTQVLSTSSPSMAPSNAPSNAPSLAPTNSPIPSVAPSELPTGSPSADFCDFGFNISCVELLSRDPCEAFRPPLPPIEDCEFDPIEVTLLFNASDCISGTYTTAQFSCEDFNGGPTQSESAFIQVTSVRNTSVVYFAGMVAPNATFSLTHPQLEPISDTLNVSIYSASDDDSDGSMLQESIFEFNCTANTFLFNRFGASQFVGFKSIEQGIVSPLTDVPKLVYDFLFQLHVTNVGVTPAIITSLVLSGNRDPPTQDFTSLVTSNSAKGLLNPGEPVPVDFIVPAVEIVPAQKLDFLPTGVGISEGNTVCGSTGIISVTIGSNFDETDAPDETVDEETDDDGSSVTAPSCDITATISCVGTTPLGAYDCSRLLTCPHPFPSVLNLTFSSENCDGAADCVDFFRGGAGMDQAIVIIQAQDSLLLEQSVTNGERIMLRSDVGLGPYINITVLDDKRTRPLQTLQLSTCPTDALFAEGTRHGAFTINSVTESVASRPLAAIKMQAHIQNVGVAKAKLTKATAITPTGDRNLFQYPYTSRSVGPGDGIVVDLSIERVDDWLSKYTSGNLWEWSVLVSGESEDGQPCRANDTILV